MAVNIMHQLDKDFNLQSGHGGTIMDKLNAGTIADRVKALHEAQAEAADGE